MAFSWNQLSSLFVGLLFACSASVQLNDSDWYFWFPLYAFAAGVTILHINFTWRVINQSAMLVLCGGILLLIKVLIEDQVNGSHGFWCIDMRERIVREKIGSGFVVISMIQRLTASRENTYYVITGNALVVALSFGLSLYFSAFVRQEMKLQ